MQQNGSKRIAHDDGQPNASASISDDTAMATLTDAGFKKGPFACKAWKGDAGETEGMWYSLPEDGDVEDEDVDHLKLNAVAYFAMEGNTEMIDWLLRRKVPCTSVHPYFFPLFGAVTSVEPRLLGYPYWRQHPKHPKFDDEVKCRHVLDIVKKVYENGGHVDIKRVALNMNGEAELSVLAAAFRRCCLSFRRGHVERRFRLEVLVFLMLNGAVSREDGTIVLKRMRWDLWQRSDLGHADGGEYEEVRALLFKRLEQLMNARRGYMVLLRGGHVDRGSQGGSSALIGLRGCENVFCHIAEYGGVVVQREAMIVRQLVEILPALIVDLGKTDTEDTGVPNFVESDRYFGEE